MATLERAKQIIILGTAGNCVDILDTINDINERACRPRYECIGFLDDDSSTWDREIHGVRVLGPLTAAAHFPDAFFVNGIGSPGNFWKKAAIIGKTGVPLERFETIIHPTASVSRMARIGRGGVIFQNVTVTSNVAIGNHVIILPNSVLSHDNIIGDYTCITGGVAISGGVKVGASCYLGSNSTIRNNIEIGDYCLVGMGSVVLNSVPTNSVVVGSPATFLRHTREV